MVARWRRAYSCPVRWHLACVDFHIQCLPSSTSISYFYDFEFNGSAGNMSSCSASVSFCCRGRRCRRRDDGTPTALQTTKTNFLQFISMCTLHISKTSWYVSVCKSHEADTATNMFYDCWLQRISFMFHDSHIFRSCSHFPHTDTRSLRIELSHWIWYAQNTRCFRCTLYSCIFLTTGDPSATGSGCQVPTTTFYVLNIWWHFDRPVLFVCAAASPTSVENMMISPVCYSCTTIAVACMCVCMCIGLSHR